MKGLIGRDATRRAFLASAGCVAATVLLDGCNAVSTMVVGPPQTTPPAGTTSLPAALVQALQHFIVTGQSLACGQEGGPPLSTVQPFDNRMFTYPHKSNWQAAPVNYNAVTNGYTGITLQPLVNGPAPNGATGGAVETLSNGFADSLTARVMANYAIPNNLQQLLSCSGEGAHSYLMLAGPTDAPPQGTFGFLEMMSQVALGQTLAAAEGMKYNVPAMLLVHGEADIYNQAYGANLKTWQSDMQRGVNALTGGSGVIPVIAAQTQCHPGRLNVGGRMIFAEGAGGLGTLQAAVDNAGVICLACPEYMMAHGSEHMTGDGYRHLGEMMAKAAYQMVVQGKWWWPLMPSKTTQSGAQIVIDYNVPHGPLAIDTTWVSDPGNYGFQYTGGAHVTIANVAVTSATQVTVTLSSEDTGGTLSYALDSSAASDTPELQGYGPQAGPRGCVRDSDPAVSYYRDSVTGEPYPLQNYSVAWQVSL
jgi:hypothetical protein